MPDNLERIYRAVPSVACQGLCAEYCGPIDMSDEERRRITARGVTIPHASETLQAMADGADGECPALMDGRCSVYEDRPLICRLWGAVESMPCPHGCEVTPGLLVDAGAGALIARSLKMGSPGSGQPAIVDP